MMCLVLMVVAAAFLRSVRKVCCFFCAFLSELIRGHIITLLRVLRPVAGLLRAGFGLLVDVDWRLDALVDNDWRLVVPPGGGDVDWVRLAGGGVLLLGSLRRGAGLVSLPWRRGGLILRLTGRRRLISRFSWGRRLVSWFGGLRLVCLSIDLDRLRIIRSRTRTVRGLGSTVLRL